MKNFESSCRTSGLAFIAFAALCIMAAQGTHAAAQNSTPGAEPGFQLKAESRLVLVNVVVRDKKGQPMEGLSKDDFKIFDRGKEQTIQQFEFEKGDEAPFSVTQNSKAADQIQGDAAAATGYTALFFDNLNDSEADLMRARDAAREYLDGNLNAANRVAIFTSDRMISDFNSDPIHTRDALSLVQPSARSRHRGGAQLSEGDDLSDYQAMQMLQSDDCEHSNAWLVATAPTGGCYITPPPGMQGSTRPTNPHIPQLKMKAREIADVTAGDTRADFQQLQAIVKYLSAASGRRTLIVISSGFLSQDQQNMLDGITVLALRSQVVINCLDPKGLNVSSVESAGGRGASADPRANSARVELDRARQLAATDVLQEFAEGTGGQFIQNDNDLNANLKMLGGRPAHYVLSFNPGNVKEDGKYHELRVTLRDSFKGMRVQARKGYFASNISAGNAADASADGHRPVEPIGAPRTAPAPSSRPEVAGASAAADSAMQLQTRVDSALKSQEELTGLPIGMELKSSAGADAGSTLSVLTHLDVTSLHFLKEGDRNLDTIIFTIAVFDQKGTMVSAKRRSVKINATETEVESLRNDGLEITTEFALQSGTYRVRAVVADSVEGKLAAMSRDISTP